MLVFLTVFVAAIWGSGTGYLMPDRGLLRALVWPFALGVALARFVERETRSMK